MPEESQTNVSSFGDDEVKEPKTVQPDNPLNPDVENVKLLTDNFPQFKGQNPYHVKKALLEDTQLFEQTTKQYFTTSYGRDELADADPEQINDLYATFKKNFKRDLVQSSYVGESTDETLIKRSVDVTDDINEIPTDDYYDIVSSNPKKYQKWGLTKSDKSLVYDPDDKTFAQTIVSDPELHKEIEKDRYARFKKEMASRHNDNAVFDNPANKTKAWVIYDKQGAEGLTKYVNAVETLQDESIAQGFEGRRKAQEYLQNVTVGDKSLSEFYNNYVTGTVKDTPFGDLIAEASYENDIDPALLAGLIKQESNFKPDAVSSVGATGLAQLMEGTASDLGVTDRTDPVQSINGGAKYLSQMLQRYDGDIEKALSGYNAGPGNTDKAIRKAQKEGGSWKDYLPMPEETLPYIENVTKNTANFSKNVDHGLVFRPTTPRQEMQADIPKDLNAYNGQFYKKEGKKKELTKSFKEFVSEYIPQNVAKNLNSKNLKKNGPFSEEYEEITYSIFEEAARGKRFDTEDLLNTIYANSKHVKTEDGKDAWAFDYNNQDYPVKYAFDALQWDNNLKYLIEEQGGGEYRINPNRRQEALKQWGEFYNGARATDTKIQRNPDGTVSFVEEPDKSLLGQSWNSLVALGMGGAATFNDYAVRPLADGMRWLSERTDIVDEDWAIRAVEDAEMLSGVNPSEITNTEEDGAWVAGVGEAAPFISYMAGMWATGGAITKAAGLGLRSITGGKASLDAIKLGKMFGSPRFAAMGNVLTKNPNTVAKLYAGGMAMETLTPSEQSFYNVIPQLAGFEQTNNVSEFYNRSSGITKTFMDAAGSLVIDRLADKLIGGARYGKDWIQKLRGKDEFTSYQWTPGTPDMPGHYRITDTPKFKDDLKGWWSKFSNDLARKPTGDVGEAVAKDIVGEDLSNLAGVVKAFTDDVSGVAGPMKNEIRSHIRTIQDQVGGNVKLTDDQIDQYVEEQYNYFVRKAGENINTLLKTSDDSELPLKFADMLEQQLPTTKEFKVGGKSISPAKVGFWRSKGNNLVVKDDKVFELDPKFWAVDLAEGIRRDAFRTRINDLIDKKVGNKVGSEAAAIKQEIRNTIGTTTEVDGKLGYVVDFNDAGYTVRTADGNVRATSLKSEIDIDSAIDETIERGLHTQQTFTDVEQQLYREIQRGNNPEQARQQLKQLYEENPQLNRRFVKDVTDSRYRQTLDNEYVKKYRDKVNQFAKELDRASKMKTKLDFCN